MSPISQHSQSLVLGYQNAAIAYQGAQESAHWTSEEVVYVAMRAFWPLPNMGEVLTGEQVHSNGTREELVDIMFRSPGQPPGNAAVRLPRRGRQIR